MCKEANMDNLLVNDYYNEMLKESEQMIEDVKNKKNEITQKQISMENKLDSLEQKDENEKKPGKEDDVHVFDGKEAFIVVSPEEYLTEATENKKRKRKKMCYVNKRDALDAEITEFERIMDNTLDKSLNAKVKRDTSINPESYDATDGVIKDSIQVLKEKIINIKNTFKDIIGSDLITTLTHTVKTMNQHVRTGKNITLTYLKKIIELIEKLSSDMVALTIM